MSYNSICICGRAPRRAPRWLSIAGAIGLASTSALAGGGPPPIYSTPVFNPANGHYYAYVQSTPFDTDPLTGITWSDARTQAETLTYLGRQGHLATLTTAQENQFIVDNLVRAAIDLYWIGGFQPAGSAEPNSDWQWVTGETWSYTNWEPIRGEPNNGGGTTEEDVLSLWRFDWFLPEPLGTYPLGVWNDEPSDYGGNGYVVEFPIPAPGATVVLALAGMCAVARRRRGASR